MSGLTVLLLAVPRLFETKDLAELLKEVPETDGTIGCILIGAHALAAQDKGPVARAGSGHSGNLNARRPCSVNANPNDQALCMQADLREFVARVMGTIAMTLIPVKLIAPLTLPSNLHHHVGTQPCDATAHGLHMT